MKSVMIAALAAFAAGASAQVISNPNGTYSCPPGASAFCAGDSGKTNIILRCVNGVGQPGNCNDNLAGSCGGVCVFAPCRQSSPTAGDAQCSLDGAFNATGYPISASSSPPGYGTTSTQTPPGYGTTTQTPPGYGTTTQTPPGYGTTTQTPPGYSTSTQTPPGYSTSTQTPPSYSTSTPTPPGYSTTPSPYSSSTPVPPSYSVSTSAVPSVVPPPYPGQNSTWTATATPSATYPTGGSSGGSGGSGGSGSNPTGSASPSQYTGAAVRNAVGGLAALAAAGAFVL